MTLHPSGLRWFTWIPADGGVGSDSTWQMLGTINYQWRENIHFSLGYRHLQVNYRNHGKQLDFSQSGPLVGATFQF